MADTFTANLNLRLIETGAYDNTWGTKTATDVLTIIDNKLGNTFTVADVGGTKAITQAEQTNLIIKATAATLTSNLILQVSGKGQWVFWNATSAGAFTVTAEISGGGSVTIPRGGFVLAVGDGTDLKQAADLFADETPQLSGFLDPNSNYIGVDQGTDLASAAPLVIGTDGDYFDVTGTTNFAAMTVAADRLFALQFDAILTMTHHATNLDLPGEANIITAAGDVAMFFATGANTVQCIQYTRADGTAIVNDLVKDASPQLGGFLDPNGNYIGMDKGGDIASASPLVVDTDGDYFDVTGTTGFAAMTVAANRFFVLQFDAILTLTHHATNLNLPGGANIITAVGDRALFFSTGTDTVHCLAYTKASGLPVIVRGITDVQNFTTPGADTWTKPTAPAPSANAKALIEIWGGGGSGKSNNSEVATGGGGGGYFTTIVPVASLGATESMTVGAGGAGALASNGNVGTNSIFGTGNVRLGAQFGDRGAATGGDGGDGITPDFPAALAGVDPGGGGAGGSGAVGVDSVNGGGGGGDGGAGSGFAGGSSYGGGGGGGGHPTSGTASGGTSVLGGNGGDGHATTPTAGADPGGGGGGCNAATTSGAGGDGQIRVTIFE